MYKYEQIFFLFVYPKKMTLKLKQPKKKREQIKRVNRNDWRREKLNAAIVIKVVKFTNSICSDSSIDLLRNSYHSFVENFCKRFRFELLFFFFACCILYSFLVKFVLEKKNSLNTSTSLFKKNIPRYAYSAQCSIGRENVRFQNICVHILACVTSSSFPFGSYFISSANCLYRM